jgi:hypothetical protein
MNLLKEENCLNCDNSIIGKYGYTCSNCAIPVYCCVNCQKDHWYKCHHKDCHISINEIINDPINKLDKNIREYIIRKLLLKGIDNKYVEFLDKYNIPINVSKSNKLKVESTNNGILLFVITYKEKDIDDIIDLLSEPIKPLNSIKYTKFTYYLKIYFTLRSLNKTNLKNNNNKLKHYGNLGIIESLPNEKIALNNLTKLKNTSIFLANNISKDDLINYIIDNNIDKNNLENEKKLWSILFDRFKIITNKKTIFLEKYLDIIRRAYNINHGDQISIILRSCIDPNNILLNIKSLLLLLIHELSHTFSYSGYINDEKNKNKIFIKPEKDHGIRFQTSMIYLFHQAYKLKLVPFLKKTYSEYEMCLRKGHQDSSLGLSVNLNDL